MEKILITEEGRKFYVKDISKDFHTQYGVIKASDLKNNKVKTNTGKELSCFPASIIDKYEKIKRGAQIPLLKDIGVIIAKTGLNNTSVVVDSGSGSGALSCMLALHAKKVHSFDIRDDHIKIAKYNKELLGIKNLTIKKHDIYESVPVKNVDIITLDVPEPWKAIKGCATSLKPGGFLVSYSPSISQVAEFVNNLNKNFIHLKSVEIHEREWEIDKMKIRPKIKGVGHSGFLTFSRRI